MHPIGGLGVHIPNDFFSNTQHPSDSNGTQHLRIVRMLQVPEVHVWENATWEGAVKGAVCEPLGRWHGSLQRILIRRPIEQVGLQELEGL